jgi:hypothetical protein
MASPHSLTLASLPTDSFSTGMGSVVDCFSTGSFYSDRFAMDLSIPPDRDSNGLDKMSKAAGCQGGKQSDISRGVLTHLWPTQIVVGGSRWRSSPDRPSGALQTLSMAPSAAGRQAVPACKITPASLCVALRLILSGVAMCKWRFDQSTTIYGHDSIILHIDADNTARFAQHQGQSVYQHGLRAGR